MKVYRMDVTIFTLAAFLLAALVRAHNDEAIMADELAKCKAALEADLAAIPQEGIKLIPDNANFKLLLKKEGRFDTHIRYYKKADLDFKVQVVYHDFLYPGFEMLEEATVALETETGSGGDGAENSQEDADKLQSTGHPCSDFLHSLRAYPFKQVSGLDTTVETLKSVFIYSLDSEESSFSCIGCTANSSAEGADSSQAGDDQSQSEESQQTSSDDDSSASADPLEIKKKCESGSLKTSEVIYLTNKDKRVIGTVTITKIGLLLYEVQARLYGHTLVNVFNAPIDHQNNIGKFVQSLRELVPSLVLTNQNFHDIIDKILASLHCHSELAVLGNDFGVHSLSLVNKNEKVSMENPEEVALTSSQGGQGDSAPDDQGLEATGSGDEVPDADDDAEAGRNEQPADDQDSSQEANGTYEGQDQEITGPSDDARVDDQEAVDDSSPQHNPSEDAQDQEMSDEEKEKAGLAQNQKIKLSRKLLYSFKPTKQISKYSLSKDSALIKNKVQSEYKNPLIRYQTKGSPKLNYETGVFGFPRITLGSKSVPYTDLLERQLALAEIDDPQCPFRNLDIHFNEIQSSHFPYIQFKLRTKDDFIEPLVMEYFLRRSSVDELQDKVQQLFYSFIKALNLLRKPTQSDTQFASAGALLTNEDFQNEVSNAIKAAGLDLQVNWKTINNSLEGRLGPENRVFLSLRTVGAQGGAPKYSIVFHCIGANSKFKKLTKSLAISARKADKQFPVFVHQLEEHLKTYGQPDMQSLI